MMAFLKFSERMKKIFDFGLEKDERCAADDVENNLLELTNQLHVLDVYDHESPELLDVMKHLTSPSSTTDNDQDDELTMNHLDTSDNAELAKPFTRKSRKSTNLNRNTIILAKEVVKWCRNTLLVLIFMCHFSPLVGAPNYKKPGCEYSTKDFRILNPNPNEDCESLQQYSCENEYIKACIRDYSHSFLVAVCTQNVCLPDKACAEYQNTTETNNVITACPWECSSCPMSDTDNLKTRMESGEGKECLELKSVGTNQIVNGVLLFIAVVLPKTFFG